MTAEDKKEIKIKISSIQELEYAYKEIPDDIEKIEFGKNLFFALNFLYDPRPEENTFRLKTHIKYSLEGQEEPVLTFLNEIIFDVVGMEEVVKQKDGSGEMEINNNFLIPLISVAIGTSRGMLVSKTIGKKISRFPVPMLNPQEVLEKINAQK